MNKKQKIQSIIASSEYNENIYIDIFNIIKDVNYTSKQDGIYFNLNDCNTKIINKLYNYLTNLEKNRSTYFESYKKREETLQNLKKTLPKDDTKPTASIFKNTKVNNDEDRLKQQKIDSVVPIRKPKKKLTGTYLKLHNILKGNKHSKDSKKDLNVKKKTTEIDSDVIDLETSDVEEESALTIEYEDLDKHDYEELFGSETSSNVDKKDELLETEDNDEEF